MNHPPVLIPEVIDFLRPATGSSYIDATFGAGGHSRALFAAGAGKIFACDRDPVAAGFARDLAAELDRDQSLVFHNVAFSRFDDRLARDTRVDGVLFDLGVSSMQIETAHRGFSYTLEGPLDMRMSADGITARRLLEQCKADRLAQILRDFGDLKNAGRLARVMIEAAQKARMQTTADLKQAIASCCPPRHFPVVCRRVFQALRIAVNRELDELIAALPMLADRLAGGGRLAVISFHSLEDRIVKNFFRQLQESGRDQQKPAFALLTKKPVLAGNQEKFRNPRATAAKLRVIARCGHRS